MKSTDMHTRMRFPSWTREFDCRHRLRRRGPPHGPRAGLRRRAGQRWTLGSHVEACQSATLSLQHCCPEIQLPHLARTDGVAFRKVVVVTGGQRCRRGAGQSCSRVSGGVGRSVLAWPWVWLRTDGTWRSTIGRRKTTGSDLHTEMTTRRRSPMNAAPWGDASSCSRGTLPHRRNLIGSCRRCRGTSSRGWSCRTARASTARFWIPRSRAGNDTSR
jgi:hypothetical protein